MSIKIECDECGNEMDLAGEMICRRCYDGLVEEKDNLEDELQKKIATLEDELSKWENREI